MVRLFDARELCALVAMHALIVKAYGPAECEGDVPQADGHLATRAYQIADAMQTASAPAAVPAKKRRRKHGEV
jgi:hypothetical protein